MEAKILDNIVAAIEMKVMDKILENLGLSTSTVRPTYAPKYNWNLATPKFAKTRKSNYDIAVSRYAPRKNQTLAIYINRKLAEKYGISETNRVEVRTDASKMVMISKTESRCTGVSVGRSGSRNSRNIRISVTWKGKTKENLKNYPECLTHAKFVEASDGVIIFKYPEM